MKKLIAILLMIAMLVPSLAACGGNTDDPADGTSGDTSAATSGEDEQTGPTTDLKVGTYKFTNVATGKTLTYNPEEKGSPLTIGQDGEVAVGVNHVYTQDEVMIVLEIGAIETKAHNDKDISFENFEINGMALTIINFAQGELKPQSNKKENMQQWKAQKNDDGTYTFIPRTSSVFALGMTEDSLTLTKELTSDTAKWQVESISTSNSRYLEYVSDAGDVAVRLPLDIHTETTITGERVTTWANDLEKVLDVYEELTSFHAQDTIFIHAYNYQGVMAGVIGTDQVYVNCGPGEWFYSDMQKMMDRTEKGAHDINFMALHEIGHLFDYNRGWNFESEMTADLKAAYALYSIEGSVAAPAEYGASSYFDYETIHEGYAGLGGGRMTSKYSIYRLAEILTNVSYQIGWEPYKQTFAWFQELDSADVPPTRDQKFKTFLQKLSDFSGQDVFGMINAGELAVCYKDFSES